MPQIDAEIFTLSGDAQYEGKVRGIDILRANAGVDVAVNIEAAAEFCHGIQLSLGADASAEAKAALSMFIAIAGELQAFAAAGANVKVALTPDIFDKFGLVGDVGAYAEASAAARLSIGLSIGQIRQAAEELISDFPDMLPNKLALDIFNAFIDEIDVRAGAWGRASAAAMARGHLQIYGSLADSKKSGFVFELGAAAGWGVGTGWDFFAVAQMSNPERFYTRATDLITAEVVAVSKENLPAEYYPIIELVDFCLPAVFQLSMVAGQATATTIATNPESIAEPVVEALIKSSQRYVLRKLISASQVLIEELIRDMIDFITKDYLTDSQREEVKVKIEALINWLDDDVELNLDSFIEFSSQLTDIMVILLDEEVEKWREPLAVMWCGLSITHVIDEIVEPISGNVGVVGFTASGRLSEQNFEIPNPPDIVLDEMEDFLGTRPHTLKFNDVVGYLSAGTIAPFIEELIPDLSILLKLMKDNFGVTSGDFISAILLGSVGGNVTTSELYIKFKGVLKTAIDEHIDKELLPNLKNEIPEESQIHLYIDEVVEPSLLGCSNFVFERLDGMISGNVDDIFVDSLRIGLSNLVYKVFARNVVVLGHLTSDYVINSLEDEFIKLENDVKNDPDHLLVTLNAESVKALSFQLVSDKVADEASRQLITDVLSIAQKTFGKEIWTQDRRERLRKLLLASLVGDNLELDYRDHSALEEFFLGILECNHVPNAEASGAVAALISEITLDQILVLTRKLPSALSRYQLALTKDILEQGSNKIKEAVNALENLAEGALETAQRYANEVERFAEEAEEAASDFANQLTIIETRFSNNSVRNEILDDIGNQSTSGVPSFLGARDAAIFLYDNTIRPLIDSGLQALGWLVRGIADVIKDTLRFVDLMPRIYDFVTRKIEHEISHAINVDLPDWLLPLEEIASLASRSFIDNNTKLAIQKSYRKNNEKKSALLQKNRSQARKANSNRIYNENIRRLESLSESTSSYNVKILSPSDSSVDTVVHEVFIPIEILIKGVNATFFENGEFRRVFITINGRNINYSPNNWSGSSTGFRYKSRFLSAQEPIKAGINTLECNIIDLVGNIKRSHISFIVNPKTMLLITEPVLVSRSGGHVSLRNTSDESVNVEGWVIRNTAGDSVSLPSHTINPGEAIRVLDDSVTATTADISFNTTSPVLRDTSRSVFLIDRQNVLRSINHN